MKFIGDVHGKFKDLNMALIGEQQPVFQVGDLGIGFSGLVYPKKFFPDFYFIRGNHDNPLKCSEHPNFIGDWGFRTIEGHNIFFVGGADSIDKELRTIGVNWWENEEISIKNFEEVWADYIKITNARLNPWMDDLIFVSHDCPQAIREKYFNIHRESKTAHYLDRMFNWYSPRLWIFGHHHKHLDIVERNTRFICLKELEIFEI